MQYQVSINSDTGLTFATWVAFSSLSNTQNFAVFKSGDQVIEVVFDGTAGTLSTVGLGTAVLGYPFPAPVGTFGHVCMTYSGSKYSLYFNGASFGSSNTANSTWSFNRLNLADDSYRFDGSLADFRLYNTALSSAQVALLYNSYGAPSTMPAPPPPASPPIIPPPSVSPVASPPPVVVSPPPDVVSQPPAVLSPPPAVLSPPPVVLSPPPLVRSPPAQSPPPRTAPPPPNPSLVSFLGTTTVCNLVNFPLNAAAICVGYGFVPKVFVIPTDGVLVAGMDVGTTCVAGTNVITTLVYGDDTPVNGTASFAFQNGTCSGTSVVWINTGATATVYVVQTCASALCLAVTTVRFTPVVSTVVTSSNTPLPAWVYIFFGFVPVIGLGVSMFTYGTLVVGPNTDEEPPRIAPSVDNDGVSYTLRDNIRKRF